MNGNALKNFTYGIYFLGSIKPGGVNAMIASWVTQVSFNPRRVAVGVKKERYSHDLIRNGGVFSLCILDKKFKEKLDLFKTGKSFEENRISGFEYDILESGAPVLKDCVSFIECKVVQEVDAGDHTLFIGEIINEGARSGIPLISSDLEGHFYGG